MIQLLVKIMRVFYQRNYMRILYYLFVIVLLINNVLFAQQTMNVFIVVIDGARYSETFGDPSHRYIPRIWNDLRPIGTTYSSFYIEGRTQTNPGHAAIVTGTWQYIPNDGSVRPRQPTIFEYYRKEKIAAINECFVILGKDKLNVLAYSDHGEYSYPYRGVVKYSASPYDDNVTFKNFRDVIVTSQPHIGIINLAATDDAGHSGIWSRYVNALRTADSLTYEIWRTLQSDPFYQGKTTLIITGDHGRHLDHVADGFKSHGDTCEGCRHIATMIIGPDTPAGRIDSTRRLQIDIAPTVGKFLDFDVKYSTGSVMSSAFLTKVKSADEIIPERLELFQNYPNPFNPSTTLRFLLPQTEFITLKVYTILGEEVARLAEGYTPPGAYEMKWDADGYPSGVYFCKLTTDAKGGVDKGSVFVNKMILNK